MKRTATEAQRVEFEISIAASANCKAGGENVTPNWIKMLRAGDGYDGGAIYLNGCWNGWKLARGIE